MLKYYTTKNSLCVHLPLHKFKYVLKVYSLHYTHILKVIHVHHKGAQMHSCMCWKISNIFINDLESASDIISFPFSAKKLAEELEGWLGASGLSKSSDVRAVIAP